MSITSPVPNIFVNGEGNTMIADDMLENFDHIISDTNTEAEGFNNPIIGALPYPNLITGEVTDANKIMANFNFIKSEVNLNANGLVSPIIGDLPFNIKNQSGPGSNDANQINANFQYLVDQINANVVPVPGTFVVCGPSNETVGRSPDGDTWVQTTMFPNEGNSSWRDIVYAGDRLCTVKGGSNRSAISTDKGLNWTVNLLSGLTYTRVTSDGVLFVAFAMGTETSVSSDGLNWTRYTSALPVSGNWNAVATNGTNFIALLSNSTVAATSPDGAIWTQRVLPSNVNWSDVAWGGSVFCAISKGGTVAATSTDGVTWTQRTLPSSESWSAITWANDRFVAVSENVSDVAATSPDGIVWTLRTLPSAENWVGVTYNGESILAVADNNTTAKSIDGGVSWTSSDTGLAQNAEAIAATTLQFGTF